MIKFKNISQASPYLELIKKYNDAIKNGQNFIEALCISSYSLDRSEVSSRYVNLKYIEGESFIFFSNYQSPKAKDFKNHKQIAAVFFWDSINVQIRMKGNINKTPIKFNNEYFANRSIEKNALAISSIQSQIIDSYEKVKDNYENTLLTKNLKTCPEYWGGYSFTPYYFEFWKGHELRINKREVFDKIDDVWKQSFLQP